MFLIHKLSKHYKIKNSQPDIALTDKTSKPQTIRKHPLATNKNAMYMHFTLLKMVVITYHKSLIKLGYTVALSAASKGIVTMPNKTHAKQNSKKVCFINIYENNLERSIE